MSSNLAARPVSADAQPKGWLALIVSFVVLIGIVRLGHFAAAGVRGHETGSSCNLQRQPRPRVVVDDRVATEPASGTEPVNWSSVGRVPSIGRPVDGARTMC